MQLVSLKVHVQEILVADKATADSLHALLVAGADMADLARRHSIRAETRDAGGLWNGSVHGAAQSPWRDVAPLDPKDGDG